MAFGSDPRAPQPPSFRQQAARSLTKPQAVRGRIPYFSDNFVPSVQFSGVVRLLPGAHVTPIVDVNARDFLRDASGNVMTETVPYWPYIEHCQYPARRRTMCSAGPLGEFRKKGQPCHGCDWFFWEFRERERAGSGRPSSMSRQRLWAFSALVMAPFHKVNDTARDGSVRVDPSTKMPYLQWTVCRSDGCEACAASAPTRQGHRLHWSLEEHEFKPLLAEAALLGRHCRQCQQEDVIEDLAWICQNPGCGKSVIDLRQTSLSPEQIERLTTERVTCRDCGQHGFLKDTFRCTRCAKRGAVGERVTVFDVDWTVQRVRKQGYARAALSLKPSIPRAIGARYDDELREPLDLPAIFEPTRLGTQRSVFGEIPGPGASGP